MPLRFPKPVTHDVYEDMAVARRQEAGSGQLGNEYRRSRLPLPRAKAEGLSFGVHEKLQSSSVTSVNFTKYATSKRYQ